MRIFLMLLLSRCLGLLGRSSPMLARWLVPFKIHRGHGRWGVHCAHSTRQTNQGSCHFFEKRNAGGQASSADNGSFSILQFQLSNAGGRLIIASDGIWDALSNEAAAKACRGLPAELAAKLVVKVILHIHSCPSFVGGVGIKCSSVSNINVRCYLCTASSENKRPQG